MLPRFRAALRTAALSLFACALSVGGAAPVQADPGARQFLGFGHFLDNDLIGDGKDRWQSGSYTLSWLRGPGWAGRLPQQPFEILEYRLGGSIVAPARLRNPRPGDRRYVAKSMFSVHTPFAPAPGLEADLGLGLVWTGPSNGVSQIQEFLHRVLSAPRPVVAANQWPNHLYPVATAELARPIALGVAELRPFVSARAGDESFVRAGADLAFGRREGGALWLRDEVTGQRYVGISGQQAGGTSFVLGGDIAHVFDSQYFPAAGGVALEPTRKRLRVGVTTRIGALGVFYGATWLSKEFKGQPEWQVIGSLRLRLNF
ncbi:lipid A-modifier LpxR family protein [Rhodobacter sp. TJ_12]|uniref:lipid A-modifier LpxR family protein n=1 Tax=Rhodobacter sp. TJ_12 TaxID=2029399 RepID=UPI001CBB5104|nr:lipid A-modifier LpxR family protein [Rhodobacter sp. TJ_12]